MKQTQAPIDIDLTEGVRQALESAPSRAKLAAANTKHLQLNQQRIATESEIAKLCEQIAAAEKAGSVVDDIKESARQLLAEGGEVAPFTPLREELRAAERRLKVINTAMTAQLREIRDLTNAFSVEVNRSLRVVRQAKVTAMAMALRELRTGVEHDAEVRRLLRDSGVNANRIDEIYFIGASDQCLFDTGWFESRRSQGYQLD
jgi:predicted  nucleic acid-binding Zn-ribbon protein